MSASEFSPHSPSAVLPSAGRSVLLVTLGFTNRGLPHLPISDARPSSFAKAVLSAPRRTQSLSTARPLQLLAIHLAPSSVCQSAGLSA